MTKYSGLVDGLDEDVYHGLGGLSSTMAKKILKSPAHLRHYMAQPHETKSEFDLGSAVHSKILGVGAGIAIYPDGPGASMYEWWDGEETVLSKIGGLGTNASKEFEAKARDNGLIPVKQVTANTINKIVESVLANDTARTLLENGRPEVSMFAKDPDTGVDLRGRLDFLGRRIVDVKTTATGASEADFARHAFELGYHVQYGHYIHQYELITGETPPWLFLVVETTAPYLTAIHVLSDGGESIGRDYARLARERYAECMESGRWPGYRHRTNGPIGVLEVPAWVQYEHTEQFERFAA